LGSRSLLLGWGKSNITDALGNLLLFIPLGFGLAGYLIKIIRLPKLHSLSVIILISFWLSYTIEVFQVFQSSRFPSLVDVFSNSVSGLLGFLCFSLCERKVKLSNTDRLIVFFGYLFCLKYITGNFFLSHLLANILLYIL
jgi:glycopeptide antibiotics resistance protein